MKLYTGTRSIVIKLYFCNPVYLDQQWSVLHFLISNCITDWIKWKLCQNKGRATCFKPSIYKGFAMPGNKALQGFSPRHDLFVSYSAAQAAAFDVSRSTETEHRWTRHHGRAGYPYVRPSLSCYLWGVSRAWVWIKRL